MNVQLHSTTKVVTLVVNGVDVPARIWEGVAESGVHVHAYITRIAVDKNESPEAISQFERELQEQKAPSVEMQAIPLRMII